MRYDLYVDSYRRYKRGTAKIAQWLAHAGRLCGADVDAAAQHSSGTKYLLPLSKFTELAGAIANSTDPIIEVRPELLDILVEVITLRKAATTFYQQNSSSNELHQNSNETHLYTIEVLEEVLILLKPLKQTEVTSGPAHAKQAGGSADEPSNIFDALDVEDLVEPVVHQELVKGGKGRRPQGKANSRSRSGNRSFELGSSTEELFFTLFCFYKDLHDVQTYLIEAWKDYRDGHSSLTSVAVVTDLAFDVIKRKEDELLESQWTDATNGEQTTLKDVFATQQKNRTASAVPLYWASEKEGALLNHGYLGELLYSYVSNMNCNKVALNDIKDEALQSRMYAMAEWLYVPAYIMLDCANAISEASEGHPGAPQSIFWSRNRTNSPIAVHPAKQFEHNYENFMKLIIELIQLRAAGLDTSMTSDVWTKTLCDLVDPHRDEARKRMGNRINRQARNAMPVWMTFATTIYLEIHQILGASISRAFQELRAENHKASRTITQMLQWCRHHPDPAWTKQHFTVMESVQRILSQNVEDDMVATISKAIEYPGGPTQSPHWLLRHHPLWAGVALFWIQLSMWDASIEMMNIYDGALLATHLYALSRTKEMFEWPDMEYLIELHGEEHLYYGGRPKSVSECCRKFELSMGLSAQRSAKNRHSKQTISKRGMQHAVRQHRPHAITGDLLNWRYNAIRIRAGPAEGPQMELPAFETLLEFRKRMPETTMVKRNDQSVYVVPLLSLAQKALEDDTKHLAFDYFAMHLRCWALLERLHSELRDDLKMIGEFSHPNPPREDPNTLRAMVGSIYTVISILAEGDKGVNLTVAKLAGMIVNTQGIVQRFASEQGSIGLSLMRQALQESVDDVERISRADTNNVGVTSDDGSDIDPNDLAKLSAALNLAPNQSITDEQLKDAMQHVKNTPLSKMPASQRAYLELIGAEDGNLGQGISGLLSKVGQQTSNLTSDQQNRVLQTTTLEEYVELMKTFQREKAGDTSSNDLPDAKKKRNNKNKNKNRKLRQQAAAATAAAAGDTTADGFGESSRSVVGSSDDDRTTELVKQTPTAVEED